MQEQAARIVTLQSERSAFEIASHNLAHTVKDLQSEKAKLASDLAEYKGIAERNAAAVNQLSATNLALQEAAKNVSPPTSPSALSRVVAEHRAEMLKQKIEFDGKLRLAASAEDNARREGIEWAKQAAEVELRDLRGKLQKRTEKMTA